MVNDFIILFTRIANKLNDLEKIPIDFGTGEMLYPAEIHTIDAIGDRCETVTEISNRFGITKGAVSQVIAKLNKRGYVKKVRNIANSKEIILSLTDKGQKAYQSHKDLHQAMNDEIVKVIGSFPGEWLQSFYDMLTQIEKYINEYINRLK